ncbi:lysoplasmalogenase [Cohnella mopanensis]|uniref:lysoplasmalogenase n=1 Tax=Cohnella mopanensis TaxID=2911966 RepID=UPI001EF7A65E|nr:lysoplasmalogenase [Cohnella mopanensis]
MKKYGLPALILLMGLLYIFVIPKEPQGVKLLFKLIPMALIIVYAYFHFPAFGKRYHWTMLAGLVFCMMGDGLLVWFIVGLSSFLIGHLFYMTAFFSKRSLSKLRVATIIPIALYAAFMGNELIHALIRDDKHTLIVPVIVYVAVISLMAWSAILSGNKLAIAGSLLFVTSDSILSWNLFVSDVAYSGVWIMTTYYAAQFLMAHSLRPQTTAISPPAAVHLR